MQGMNDKRTHLHNVSSLFDAQNGSYGKAVQQGWDRIQAMATNPARHEGLADAPHSKRNDHSMGNDTGTETPPASSLSAAVLRPSMTR